MTASIYFGGVTMVGHALEFIGKMRTILLVSAAFCSLFNVMATSAADDAAAIPPLYPVEAFAKLPGVFQPRLSPDGKTIAYVTSAVFGRKSVIAHPITGFDASKAIILPHIGAADIKRFMWANDDTLLAVYSFFGRNFYYRGKKLGQTRLVSASFGQDAFDLVKRGQDQEHWLKKTTGAFAAEQANIVDMLPQEPGHILLAISDGLESYNEPSVRRINVKTGEYSTARDSYVGIYEWLTDGNGVPVLGYGTYAEHPKIYIQEDKRALWSLGAIVKLLRNGYTPIDLHEDGRTAIFAAENEEGRRSLGRFDLTNGALVEWIYSNPTYDIDDLYRSSINGRLVGTGYVDTTSRQVFLEGKEKAVLAAINALLPGASNRLLGSDKSGRLWLVRSDAPRKTPKTYSFDAQTDSLAIFTNAYEDIDDAHVAPVEMHRVEMRDALSIEAYVTVPLGRETKALPTVLLPHGGPWARDTAEFNAEAQFLANRGYLVIQPNFRGSTGYGEAFKDMSYREWGGAMQDDLTDTAQWAIDQGLADPKRICIIGGSYGGYAALMGAVKTPDLFACAASINGVTNLPLLWSDDRKFIWYERMRKSIGERRSDLKDISPYHRAREIKIPVLLIAAKDDDRVSYKHSKKMHKALKKRRVPVTYLELEAGGHSIDIDAERVRYFKAMDAFLLEHLGPLLSR